MRNFLRRHPERWIIVDVTPPTQSPISMILLHPSMDQIRPVSLSCRYVRIVGCFLWLGTYKYRKIHASMYGHPMHWLNRSIPTWSTHVSMFVLSRRFYRVCLFRPLLLLHCGETRSIAAARSLTPPTVAMDQIYIYIYMRDIHNPINHDRRFIMCYVRCAALHVTRKNENRSHEIIMMKLLISFP